MIRKERAQRWPSDHSVDRQFKSPMGGRCSKFSPCCFPPPPRLRPPSAPPPSSDLRRNCLPCLRSIFFDSSSRVERQAYKCSFSAENGGEGEREPCPSFSFTEFRLEQLEAATSGFSPENVVRDADRGVLGVPGDVVYRGELEDGRSVAVKRYERGAWPDPQGFLVRLTA